VRFVKYSLLLAPLSALALGACSSAESPGPRPSPSPITITIDAPGAGGLAGQTPLPQGTFPYAINEAGAIGGHFQDANNVLHGFIRAADGLIVAFDAPGAGTGAFQGTQGFAINSEGAIVGK
jgi:hypothetical protein